MKYFLKQSGHSFFCEEDMLALISWTRLRLQECLHPGLNKEKEWNSKKIGFILVELKYS